MKLNEASCVITGAAKGIGFAIAEALIHASARVVLSDSDAPALKAAVSKLNHPAAIGVCADVTSSKDMLSLASAAEIHAGPITLWINNAGLAKHRSVKDYS
jgi:NAD(P)-dependent dehydrogenase (short-subunit alcohol dehydrogenase family)